MCYSNPNPIWSPWRWHADDVRGGTQKIRVSALDGRLVQTEKLMQDFDNPD